VANVVSSVFRKDINGLRAIAIVTVVLFHFGVRGFGGGFVGVDVFFVISGYLMMQIVSTRLAAGRFSLLDFYASRARRIVPSLAAMIGVLLVLGYFWLDHVDYLILGKHAAASLTFTSNLLYWRESGYFDLGSQEKWLLHTWSLSVEWQFYLLFPVFLVALNRLRGGGFLGPGICLAMAGSLLLSIFLTPRFPVLAFYTLATRSWELLAGSVCQLYRERFAATPRRTWPIGLGLVTLATLFYTEHLAYPGFWAIAPVVGASLVLLGNDHASALSTGALQFLGDISYSLYLWHWPVLVAARYFGVQLSATNIAVLLVVSAGCSYASYAAVEVPMRRRSSSSGRFLVIAGGIVATLTGFASVIWYKRGLPRRLPPAAVVAANETFNNNPGAARCLLESSLGSGLPECRIGATSVLPSVALWGDSHGLAVLSAVGEALSETGRAGVFYGMSGCPPLLGVSGLHGRPQCAEFNAASARRILGNDAIHEVIIVGRWSAYPNAAEAGELRFPATSGRGYDLEARANERASYYSRITEDLCVLAATGRRVTALGPIPEMNANVPVQMARAAISHLGSIDLTVTRVAYLRRNSEAWLALRAAESCGVRIIDPASVLCNESVCAPATDGRPLYFDNNHLSEFGNRFLIALFAHAIAADAQ
jgi:peptidoglycan/LPS O-acetylase OafA/YrhL